MRFMITPEDDVWAVRSTETHGQNSPILMRAEILDIEDVSLHEGRLYAEILAAWGVTQLDPFVEEHPYLLRYLGIGRSFRHANPLSPVYSEDGRFFCGETNQILYHATRMLLVHGRLYQSRGAWTRRESREHREHRERRRSE